MKPDHDQLVDLILDEVDREHRRLAGLANGLSELQLARRSGASEWTLNDVFAHLGCGAEVGRERIMVGLRSKEDSVDVQSIWSRWTSLTPLEHAQGFVEHDAAWAAEVRGIPRDERDSIGFGHGLAKEPVSITTLASLRLNELDTHSLVGPSRETRCESGGRRFRCRSPAGVLSRPRGLLPPSH